MSEISADTLAKIRAIKAKMQGEDAVKNAPAAAAPAAKSDAGGDAPAAAPAATAEAPAAADDMQARIAALKAKMDAGKGQTAPKAAAAAKQPAPKKAAGGAKKNVYPVEPINHTGFGSDDLYEPNTVNKWFILGALVLLVSCLLMWRRDHVRDWKQWQIIYRNNEIERLKEEIAHADAAIDGNDMAEISAGLAEVEGRLAADQTELDALRAEEKLRDGEYYAANQSFQIAKSELDELRYNFEEERLKHGHQEGKLADSEEALESKRIEVANLKLAADNANNRLGAAKQDVAAKVAEQTELIHQRDELTAQVSKAELSLGKLGVDVEREEEGQFAFASRLFDEHLRNAPIADMLAPTLQIQKVVLDGLYDNYNFMYVPRVDMCMTCHISIDKPYYSEWDDANEKGERVLNAHPRLDLFVADDSPHPMGKFGCTVCHQGRGQAVEFERTFHMPAPDAHETAEEKEQRWIADFGYDPERHYWEWPMVPQDRIYSSCYQCHQEEHRLPGVPQYNESRALFEDLGCYGCHKVQGFETMRKQGPDLTNVADKVSEEWASKWLMSPKSFRPTTRMPHFWNQSNTGAPAETTRSPDREWNNNSDRFVDDYRRRNQTEARAVTAYVYDASVKALQTDGYAPLTPPDTEADPESGRTLFQERGCLGCHSLEAEGWLINDHGPDLSAIGSKVSADWLYSWVMEPKRYFETTAMPDLRLEPQEAWDMTAYLMGFKDQAFTAMAQPTLDVGILDDIAAEYLSTVAGDDWARERIAEMRADGGDEAVELFVGEKLFGRYGCAGCHLVPGHYEDKGIGTELTYEGLKEITKLDFGHEGNHANPEAIPHTRHDWFASKLGDPRVFDRMPVVGRDDNGDPVVERYDMKVKMPGEKLKMPNFYLDQDEVRLLVQFLMGLREDGIDETMKHSLNSDERLVEEGSRLITQYNCIGCHRMGQLPQPLAIEGGHDLDAKIESLEEIIDDIAFDYGLWMAGDMVIGEDTIFRAHEWMTDEFYYPEWEEDADLYEYIEEQATAEDIPDEVYVYGYGEGGMGRYIDAKAMRPPILRGEGAKVNPDWLFEFLIQPYIVRTHVQVRMPTFGLTPDESLALVRWFSAQTEEPWPFEVDEDAVLDENLLDYGYDKFANVLQCNSCHPAGDELPSNEDKTNWGPDLSMAAERLKSDWIRMWLLDPQLDQPGTKMPSFFGEFAEDTYEEMYDDYEEQIRALQHYLKHMDAHMGASE